MNKLHAVYECQSTNVNTYTLQQFFIIKFEDKVTNFSSRIPNLTTAIKQQNEDIPVKKVMIKIIMSLPEQYKHFLSAWESVVFEKKFLKILVMKFKFT